MIVMKFGGSSLAAPASIRRVASIVQSHAHRKPVVVVSALGETTDRLFEILEHATRGESYLASKLQQELRTYHFCVAEDLLTAERLEAIDQYMRDAFRDLHVRVLELCEGEMRVTPELRDWVASLGEQLASRIVAAALNEAGQNAVHADSTKLILTDELFTNAQPRYWETYARIRWSVPLLARDHVVVLGGFIGATEGGRVTTLGRGGSDLTASIMGAALNAEEVQVWKDVDGMLTWAPCVKAGGHRVKRLSYEEASELAQAGATILHPDTIRPAQRLRIPVVIRNTFHPEGEGTRIGSAKPGCLNAVKSVACKQNVTLVELRSPAPERSLTTEAAALLEKISAIQGARLLAMSDDAIYLEVEDVVRFSEFELAPGPCMQARVQTEQAILTLVGNSVTRGEIGLNLASTLAQRPATILPQQPGSCAVRLVVPQRDLELWTAALQRAFFAHVDPVFFAPSKAAEYLSTEQPQYINQEKEPVSVRPLGHKPVTTLAQSFQ